ncbi:MAG TPA: photosynthetic complex putative assembly protein PuhB [Methylibium sp.]|uniref:photosynthetic complex putative assembly protein PuhB n=1 Tax=Methylibium sp. TaxID=2067992 RepID=UPI002DB71CAA|nr:photosynthetic complex putative assembly protein PuhB [Methylibium sp.]HEU4457672.1 photosynthetic complex putative assembly protein PuhB [Methylibium sp.]
MSEGHRHTNGPEHDFEPDPGLPQKLPPGETLLWQGAPDFASVARHVFHLRKLAAYFAAMLLLRGVVDWQGGASAAESIASIARFAGLAALGLALVAGIAWLTARTTAYTLTDRRIVLRVGIVLSVSFNLPLARIESAALKLHADGSGHLPLVLAAPDKIAYLHLWPHVRAWRLARPEPMLISVPDAQRVAALVGEAWGRVHGRAVDLQAQAPAAPSAAAALRPVRGLAAH